MAARRGSWLLCLFLCLLSGVLNTNMGAEAESSDKEGPCYPELGCFPQVAPWYTSERSFPAPWEPTKIDTKIYFFSRASPERTTITLWPTVSLNNADFKADRPTAFITHGYKSSGEKPWITELKDSYLKKLDANIFIIDWGKAAKQLNYWQVAANTRVVAAEVVRFLQWMIHNQGLKPSTVHLLGHSLGAHICSYVAKRVPGIGRITGFDPAQPGFEKAGEEVRLDQSDADFVEILHTNAAPFLPRMGLGLINPQGDVDFYINGGVRQPGCKSAFGVLKDIGSDIIHLKSIKYMFTHTAHDISDVVACSHRRSYKYYTEALESSNCTMWGHKVNFVRRNVDGSNIGFLQPLFTSLKECTEDTCLPIGLDSVYYKGRGAFAVTTNKHKPFCMKDDTSSDVLGRIADTVQKPKTMFERIVHSFKKFGQQIKEFGKKVGSFFKNTFSKIF